MNIREEFVVPPEPIPDSVERPAPIRQDIRAKVESDDADIREDIVFPTRKLEPKMILEEKLAPNPTAFRGNAKEEFSEEDDLEIPAFIRRKMKKP